MQTKTAHYATEPVEIELIRVSLALSIKRPTFDEVKDLADRFRTSLTATAIRLIDMNVWPLLLICHSKQGRVWFNRSKDVPVRWFPQRELNADSLAFDRLFGNTERTKSQKINADAWFDTREAERYDLVEDAIRISENQILTLLWIENDAMLEDR